ARRLGGTARDPRARRAPADDERQAAQIVRDQVLDHRLPRRVELMRRCGTASPRYAVRLLDESDRDSRRMRDPRDRDKVSRGDPAAGAVTEDEGASRIVDALEMRPRRAERSVDLELLHRGDAA